MMQQSFKSLRQPKEIKYTRCMETGEYHISNLFPKDRLVYLHFDEIDKKYANLVKNEK